MNIGNIIFDFDVTRSELCKLEIRRKGEYICESNQIEIVNHFHKIKIIQALTEKLLHSPWIYYRL